MQPQSEKGLAVFDRLAIGDQALDHFAGGVRFDLVHQLHGFDNAQHLAVFDLVPNLDEGSRARRRRFVERTHDRRLDDVQLFFLDGRRRRLRRSGGPGRSYGVDALRDSRRAYVLTATAVVRDGRYRELKQDAPAPAGRTSDGL